MSPPLLPGQRRVQHASRLRSYGIGDIVFVDGTTRPETAKVRFEGERADRRVLAADLTNLSDGPLPRVIWPKEET